MPRTTGINRDHSRSNRTCSYSIQVGSLFALCKMPQYSHSQSPTYLKQDSMIITQLCLIDKCKEQTKNKIDCWVLLLICGMRMVQNGPESSRMQSMIKARWSHRLLLYSDFQHENLHFAQILAILSSKG